MMNKETIKYLSEYKYGKVYYLLGIIAKITTGFYKGKIRITEDECYTDVEHKKHVIYYSINGGSYQYFKFYLNIDTLSLEKIDGDCVTEIKQIVDIFHNIAVNSLLEWDEIIDIFSYSQDVYKYRGNCDSLNDKDINKINKLLKIHSNLLNANNAYNIITSLDTKLKSNTDIVNMSNTDKIIRALNDIQPLWEVDNFKEEKTGFLYYTLYGNFTNYNIPDIDITSIKLITFPDSSRGSMCSNFIALTNFNVLQSKGIGDVIKLLYNRKGSKIKEYKVIDINSDGFYAIQNVKTNKIEFVADIKDIEICYSDLFDCNKAIYNSWYRKKYEIVV